MLHSNNRDGYAFAHKGFVCNYLQSAVRKLRLFNLKLEKNEAIRNILCVSISIPDADADGCDEHTTATEGSIQIDTMPGSICQC
jgi:hypothetical protein